MIALKTHQYAKSDAEWHTGGKHETREYSCMFGVSGSEWGSSTLNVNSLGIYPVSRLEQMVHFKVSVHPNYKIFSSFLVI